MKWTLVAVASLVILLGVGSLPGQTKPLEQMSEAEIEALLKQDNLEVIKGLPGVRVHAFWKSLSPSEENDRLQIAVELRLRSNGIPVFATGDQFKNIPGHPTLNCYVSYYTIGSVVVARTGVQLVEEVQSIRTSKIHLLPTWENTLPRQKLVENLSFEEAREWLFEGVDEFCNSYRAVNPKTVP